MQVDFFDNLRNRVVIEHHNLIQQLEYQYQHHILNLLRHKAAIHAQLQSDFYQKLVEIDHLIIHTANNMASNVDPQSAHPQATENKNSKSTHNKKNKAPVVIHIESSPDIAQTTNQASSNLQCNKKANSNSKSSDSSSLSLVIPIWRCDTCNKGCKTKESYAEHIKSHSLQELRLFVDKHRDIYDGIKLSNSDSAENMRLSPSPPDILMNYTSDNMMDASPFLHPANYSTPIDLAFNLNKEKSESIVAENMVNNDGNHDHTAELLKEEGNKLLKTHKYKAAIAKYSKAIDLDDNNAIYFSNRALAHIKVGDFTQAISDSRKALEIDPYFIKAYFREGQAYCALQQYQNACDVYKKGLNYIQTDSKCATKFSNQLENKLVLCRHKLAQLNKSEIKKKRYEPQCRFCEFTAHSKDIVLQHELIHYPIYPKPFKCNICMETFVHKQHLNKHMSIHSTAHVYQCKQCRKPFKSNAGLQRHTRNAHTSSKCMRGLLLKNDSKRYKYQYTQHMDYKANDTLKDNGNIEEEEEDITKGFECCYCESVFDTWNILEIHMKKHKNEGKEGSKDVNMNARDTKVTKRTYKCSVCRKPFKKQRYLTVHFRIHTGEKPYECDQCGDRFRTWGMRDVHLRKHFEGYPYQCDGCKMKFKKKNELKKHCCLYT